MPRFEAPFVFLDKSLRVCLHFNTNKRWKRQSEKFVSQESNLAFGLPFVNLRASDIRVR